jgi:hypothetical protein
MVVIDAPNIKSVTSIVVRVSSMLECAGSSFCQRPSGVSISNVTPPP